MVDSISKSNEYVQVETDLMIDDPPSLNNSTTLGNSNDDGTKNPLSSSIMELAEERFMEDLSGVTNRDNDSFVFKDIHFLEDDEYDPYSSGVQDDPTKQLPTGRREKIKFYFCLTSYWFAYAVVASACNSLVWPSQIASIVGEALKEKYVGWLPMFGVIVSVLASPLAGALSDHSKNPFGKRRVFIFVGSIIASVFLFLLAFSKQISIFIILSMGFSFGLNWGGGPFSGLLPDLVPKSKFGSASGYLAFANALGNLFGLLGSGVAMYLSTTKTTEIDGSQEITIAHVNYQIVYIYLIIVFSIFTIPTIVGIREKAQSGFIPKLTVKRFLSSFYLPKDQYLNFYWVLVTRFFQEMGIYAVLPFFQFYLKDIIRVGDGYQFYTSIMLSIIVITSVPSSIIAGPMSDKYGRKLLVYISSGIMAGCTLLFLVLSFKPSLGAVMITAALFGCGYGAYQAVDWALALDVLPEASDIAKDMAIWHQSMVVPQVFAPLVTGMILNAFKRQSNLVMGYTVVFLVTAFWFVLATIMIKPIQIGKKDNFIRLQPQSL